MGASLATVLLSLAIDSQAVDARFIIGSEGVVSTKDFVETSGHHIILNLTGYHKYQVVLRLKFMEFHVNPSQILQQPDLLAYAQSVVEETSPTTFRVVDFIDSPFLNIDIVNFTASYPVTEEGVRIPNLSAYDENPGFQLVGNLLLEPIEESITLDSFEEEFSSYMPVTISLSVVLDYNVKFITREGTSIFTLEQQYDDAFGEFEIGEEISGYRLAHKAEELFAQTKAYQEGYRLIKRISTTILEDQVNLRSIYHLDEPNSFYYQIAERRFGRGFLSDSIAETYYVSKRGDDYTPKEEVFTIESQDENGRVLQKEIVHGVQCQEKN